MSCYCNIHVDVKMSQSITSGDNVPAPMAELDSDEETIFDRIFTRNFIFQNLERQWNDILMRHKDEIKTGAAIAKGQFGLRFGGLLPRSSEFGMTLIRAPLLGLKSWELDNAAYAGGGANVVINGNAPAAGVNTWLSKALLTGVGGDATTPLIVGRYATHVLLAIGDFAVSPVIESFQETVNGNPQPVLQVEHQFRNSQLKYLEFDEGEIYKLNTTYLWQYNADEAAASDSPYFFGVSFLPFTQSKYLNPNLFNGGSSVESVVHY
jgi:hypothetical protein